MKYCNIRPWLVAACATVVVSVPVNAQVRLGRQAGLVPTELQDLKAAIAARGGRVIIGFKPVAAASGVRADGSPMLAAPEVDAASAALESSGVDVRRRFRLIPAVSARIDSNRLEVLLADPTIDYVEAEILHEPTRLPDGNWFPGRAARQDGQQTPWGITRVDAAGAWPITRGAGAKLGIIDTGIDEDHPDLSVAGGINLVTGGTDRADWDDNSTICTVTHGTHVAGIAAALDNTIDVVGVAPEAELYALRVFDPENADLDVCAALTSDVIAALEFSVDSGLHVVNMSFGAPVPSLAEGDAVAAAAAAGVLIAAAAGNSGAAVEFPAAFPHALAVAATRRVSSYDFLASFSSRGPEIEVAAPGVDVLSTLGGGGTGAMDGTSMAAPHVAGVAALVRAARPDLDVSAVREVLRSTAEDILSTGYDQLTGYGMVQASAAVQAVGAAATAMALSDDDITVYTAPESTAVTTALEIRNVGASGTITWSATADQSWITLNPVSGTVDDVTPATIEVTADPTGLSSILHTGFVTITSDAANSPIQARVKLAVAEAIELGASGSTHRFMSDGARARFALAGSAGQRIDVALRSLSFDPVLRLYRPDGETILAMNDDAFAAGLGFNSLVYGVELPDDGIYFIEVGAYADDDGGWFDVRAREAGPILGVNPVFLSPIGIRARVDDPPLEFPIEVFNLSGVGSLTFEVTTATDWLSASPSSGVAEPLGTEALVAVGGAKQEFIRMPSGANDSEVEMPSPADPWLSRRPDDRTGAPSEDAGIRHYRGRSVPQTLLWHAEAQAEATTVTVRLDPSLAGPTPRTPASDYLRFRSSDTWLQTFDSNTHATRFYYYVYSAGMEIVSQDHDSPWGVTEAPGGRAFAAIYNTIYAMAPDGTIESTVATGLGWIRGLEHGSDGNLYVANATHTGIQRIHSDGSTEQLALLYGPKWITQGPTGEFYASSYYASTYGIWKISADGSTVEAFGDAPGQPQGLAFNPLDGKLYVANTEVAGGIRVFSLDGTQERVIAASLTSYAAPAAITVGRSGTIYVGDDWGRISAVNPADETADAELIGVAPAPAYIYGLALLDGALLMSGNDYGEFYRFPVNDGPIGGIYARLQTGALATVEGAPFSLPLAVDLRSSGFTAAGYDVDVNWPASQLTFGAVTAGDFSSVGGTFSADTSLASDGEIGVTATEPAGASDVTTLIDLALSVVPGAARGDTLDVGVLFSQLHGPASEDLLPQLTVTAAQICVDADPFGDPTGDGSVGALDAVQILRSLVGLPLAPGAEITRADVSGDGEVGIVDAAQILRYLVDLPVPPDSRVDRAAVGPCGPG